MKAGNLFLIRGLPGCGKTTLASAICGQNGSMFAADDFFMIDGEYRFDSKKLGDAHKWCQNITADVMRLNQGVNIVVHNTFTQRWEMEPYLSLADEFEYRVTVVSIFDGGCTDEELAQRNAHGVSVEQIRKMRARYEHDWKEGSSVPPWINK